ncbi:unnamed protein product [Phytophthora lilii]|uniref:Unnamed protein product n=1 Tax=Phytophthora lilii TaxID=2077276 RepID=A0A9W6TQF9_9STRA|nr:unnamed protein product [Phytophthora lilii]
MREIERLTSEDDVQQQQGTDEGGPSDDDDDTISRSDAVSPRSSKGWGGWERRLAGRWINDYCNTGASTHGLALRR